jgi:hypothetical protein
VILIRKLKNIIVEQLRSSLLFQSLSREIYTNQIKNGGRIPLEDIRRLSRPIHPLWIIALDKHYPNISYNHANIIKKFAGFKENYQLKAVVEHGIYFNSDFVEEIDIQSSLPAIITLSQYRKMALKRKTSKKIFTIGPYIHYASHHLNEIKLQTENRRLKKCLLAFPTHSTLLVNVEYDIKKYCQKLKQLGQNFNTVRVCLYWKDINLGVDRFYKKYGFECVTAGHMFDPLFLPRLKSIIETATITTSNAVGTQIGYCLYMRKPHYLYKQRYKVIGNKQQIINNDITILNEEVYQLERIFSKFSDKITREQNKLASYYWGFDEIKSKKEMKKIISQTEKLHKVL